MKLLCLVLPFLLSCACLPPKRVAPLSPPPVTRIGVIGDFGNRSHVERWASRDMELNGVTAIVTVGDNVYPFPKDINDYETHVGEFFGHWIREGRFFPAIGNHDWAGPGESETFVRYFGVPRYYDVVIGGIHFYVLDSDEQEPDGIFWDSTQAAWFRRRLEESPDDCVRFVVFHHPAISTKLDQGSFCIGCEPVPEMDWPFEDYRIDGVFSGHAHWAERFVVRGVPHWTVGNTTDDLDDVDFDVDERSMLLTSRPGYLMIETSRGTLKIGFRLAKDPTLTDVVTLQRQCLTSP